MSASTIGLALAALESIWAAAMPADVQVIYGPRGTVSVTKDKVLLIGDVDFSNDVSTMDPGFPMDEAYTIACVAEVTIPGAREQQLAVDAVLAVYGAAVATLRARPDETLGVAGLQYARVTGRGRLIHSSADKVTKVGRGASIPFTISALGVL